MTDQPTQTLSFNGLGLAPNILAILEELKYTTPTPIQHQAIPVACEGKDVVGVAQTGTGKTLAFGLPMIQRIMQGSGRGLVIVPTRELALQVDEVLRKIGSRLGVRTAVLIGGASMYAQIQSVRRDPHIIVATPGRLNDHLQQNIFKLTSVSVFVLDEADRMFDMGFQPQIKRIIEMLPPQRQTMLFSATLPPAIMKIATSGMKLPLRIEIAPQGTTADRVIQEIFVIKKDEKLRLLEKIISENKGSMLVFTRTKHGAKRINHAVRAMGYTAAELHSNRSLNQRKDALDGFRSGKYRMLIATDIAARGIDVTGIEIVVNFDLPMQAEDYVHRIGRTGRAGAEGRAISFAMPDEGRAIRDIERVIYQRLRITPLPTLPAARPRVFVPEDDEPQRFFGRRPQSRHPAPGRSGPPRGPSRGPRPGGFRPRR